MKTLKHSELFKGDSFFSAFIIPLVLAGFVTAAAYQLVFYFSPFIWSWNSRLPLSEYMPMARVTVMGPRNGIQVYVLYGLVYLIVGLTFLLYRFINKISFYSLKLGFLLLFALPALLFFKEVGLPPPMAESSRFLIHDIPGICFILSVLGITMTLSFFINKPRSLATILAALLFPICMVASEAYSAIDYNFILFPAMRIIHGFPLNQTGFQYDHLLSLLAVLWMKIGFSFYDFYMVGQISFYAFFLGLYLFGCRVFTHKGYALYCVISALLVRTYGNIADIILCFQVTPLRLDWWFVVLAAFFFKGASHWLMGAILGFLCVFHHTFGVIYALAYTLLVALLFCMDLVSKKDSFMSIIRSYAVLYAKNVFLIGLSFLLYHLYFAFGQPSASIYRQHGIGFLRISGHSFYWYVPVLLSLFFIVNWRNRSFVSQRHFQTGLFVILLAIGNSLYFFGRSHENNIINISSILLFCLFFMFDLVHSECERVFHSRFLKWPLTSLGLVFIAGISFAYSGRAPDRIGRQVENFRTHGAYVRESSIEFGLRGHMDLIRKMTRLSSHVTFVSYEDGYYYYEGGYVPQEPYCATDARLVLFKNYKAFLERALRNGHYLVIPLGGYQGPSFSEVLSSLRVRYVKIDPEMLYMSDNPIG